MNPLYFGPSSQPLFGVYHDATRRPKRDAGFVLCYPVGQEYMRAHRAFRQLATMLSDRGFPVLRFDYFGTGDSAGDSEEGSLERWVQDIVTAAAELRDTAAINRVSLLGLRLGAALAALAEPHCGQIDQLVLWDPVLRGPEYVAELLRSPQPYPDPLREQPRASLGDGGVVGVLGFPLTVRMQEELGGLDLFNLPSPVARRVLMVTSQKREDYLQYYGRVSAIRADTHFQCVPAPGNWNEVDDFGSVLLPQEMIQAIVALVHQEH